MLHAQNPSVLAYLRRGLGQDGEEDIVLCVNNLSRFPQPCELMMEQLAGKVPVELSGRIPFPPIGELPYFVTLPPHGFYWFELIDQVMDEGLATTARSTTDVPAPTSVPSIRGVGRAW
jgi:maltose alpha-D-glucosyltransferase/alpha-amylase